MSAYEESQATSFQSAPSNFKYIDLEAISAFQEFAIGHTKTLDLSVCLSSAVFLQTPNPDLFLISWKCGMFIVTKVRVGSRKEAMSSIRSS